jgi:hypothetical protein
MGHTVSSHGRDLIKVFKTAALIHAGRRTRSLVGRLLTASVAEFQKGRVRFQKPIVGNDEWACISNAEIPSGIRVRLVAIEGSMASCMSADN